MDLNKLSFNEVFQGYHYDQEKKCYRCNYCNQEFYDGQVYRIDEKFYLPQKCVAVHIEKEHGGNYHALSQEDIKYRILTETQRELMFLFSQGQADKEIAKKLNITPATVRKQKFNFRERAKQAKVYLALYEQAFGGNNRQVNEKEELIPVHENAKSVDERFMITEEERKKGIQTFFMSLEPLRLKAFPPKEKNKVIVLTKVMELFEKGKIYSEREVNDILKVVSEESYVSMRRYLITYGFMDRTKDCSEYWVC